MATSTDRVWDSTQTVNVRIGKIRPLLSPALLLEEMPASDEVQRLVRDARRDVAGVVAQKDDRLVVVVGPCSIHDAGAALEYAKKLSGLRRELRHELVVVMRVYFEKPRTTIGWKGLINDPQLDGSWQINQGLRVARRLLLDINELGVPAGVEWLDTITPQFIADLVAWGAIGARTTESQVHRQLVSGLSMPVGFKNATGGDVSVAMDACISARHPHCFLSVTHQGIAAIVETTGNTDTHVILRGGKDGPNFSSKHVHDVVHKASAKGVRPSVVIDCSHGNSNKDFSRQPLVLEDVCGQVAGGQRHVVGVMVESNLNEGKQALADKTLSQLEYGVSITDGCVSWATTETMLRRLANSVKQRRKHTRLTGASSSEERMQPGEM